MTVGALVRQILTVAGPAAIELLLSARVGVALADTGIYSPDQELVGQGLASIAFGFCHCCRFCRMQSLAAVRSALGSTRSDTVAFVLTGLITISLDLIVVFRPDR